MKTTSKPAATPSKGTPKTVSTPAKTVPRSPVLSRVAPKLTKTPSKEGIRAELLRSDQSKPVTILEIFNFFKHHTLNEQPEDEERDQHIKKKIIDASKDTLNIEQEIEDMRKRITSSGDTVKAGLEQVKEIDEQAANLMDEKAKNKKLQEEIRKLTNQLKEVNGNWVKERSQRELLAGKIYQLEAMLSSMSGAIADAVNVISSVKATSIQEDGEGKGGVEDVQEEVEEAQGGDDEEKGSHENGLDI